jgi:membrane protease YdiL (CAAX protease family)
LVAVDKAADASDDDRVRAAVVAGEIAGPDAALSRLDRSFKSPAARDDAEVLRTLYRDPGAPLTSGQRAALVSHHEWFGELALAYGRAPDDPLRRETIRPAVGTIVSVLCALAIAVLALITGLVLLIVAVVDWSGGRLRFAYTPAPPDRSTVPFLEGFAAYMAGMVVIATAALLVLGRSPAATWFVMAIIPFAFFWPLLRGVSAAELRRGLGWTRGRGVAREVGAGLLAYLAGLPVLAVGGVISLILTRLSGADTTHPIMNEIGRGGWWRAAQLFFLAAVWAPVIEETMFRGAFYHHLRRRLPWPLAAAFVGLLFAAVHPQGWAAIPTLGAIGFCFSVTREWRGSIIASAVAHALNNGAVTVLLLLMVG